jgi:predicted amidohydrolase
MLRVALLQLVSCGSDREANLHKGVAACRRAAAADADIALFPEMWSIGYTGFDPEQPGEREAWRKLAVPRESAFVTRFADLARELSLAIGITYLEQSGSGVRNALRLFDRRGEPVLDYAKTHLCPWGPPDTACRPGPDLPVATLETRHGRLRVGALVCFDREHPEPARVLGLAGAELVLVPNACDLDDRAGGIGDVRLAQLRGRAYENRMAFAMANYAAPQYDGHSVAYGPDGRCLALGGKEEGLVLAELDLEAARAFARAERRRDEARRPELYAPLASGRLPPERSEGGGEA